MIPPAMDPTGPAMQAMRRCPCFQRWSRASSSVSVSFAQTPPQASGMSEGLRDQDRRHAGGGELFRPRIVLSAEENSIHTTVQKRMALPLSRTETG